MTAPLIAMAQLPMHWTLDENLREIEAAMCFAAAEGAALCAFAELAVTGFHRGIVTEGVPAKVDPALQSIADWAAELQLAVAVGAPSFGPEGRFNSHVLIDEHGVLQARVHKNGLTAPEATFFQAGAERPLATLAGLRCSAVICREIEDHAQVLAQLQGQPPALLFWPGQMRPDPDKPVVEPWAHVQDAMRLARDLGAWIVQSNWPNALNRPEESAHTGASAIVAPDGRLVTQLPVQGFGVGLYALGDAAARWVPVETVRRTMQD
jgi:predicted amidohydrolase